MFKVVIDDEEYEPVKKPSPKIGIAVSTRNRHVPLATTLIEHQKYLPDNAYFIVVDDGSTLPVECPEWVTVVRHPTSLGIVEAKNTSLHTLIEAGCEQLFLWDDDAYPLAKGWELPYIASPEPHLSYQFLDVSTPNKNRDIAIVYKDSKHVAYTGQRGVMLYYHKSVIEKVGGFDRIYQRGMYEHVDLAMRINNAGLTTWCYADVIGSERLIYSLDEHEKIERSVPLPERKAQVERNVKIFSKRRDSFYTGYAEYRPVNRAMITVLLTAAPDPQRPTQPLAADGGLVSEWAKSIVGAKKVLLADQVAQVPGYPDVEVVRVESKLDMSPYFLRWLHIYHYLRDHPELTHVWISDGTDVTMLRSPWESMEEGVLYVGDEHSTYANPWFLDVNHNPELRAFVNENINEQVINAGLIGGERERVIAVVQGILRIYAMLKSWQFWRDKVVGEIPTDMVVFAMAVKRFGGEVKHGPQVNTVFKSKGVGKDVAWFQHK